MLRPATPLSILFFVAFVLLLLSTLSTPVIKAIPLATYKGVDFGVFGYCQSSGCSGIRVGYSTDQLFTAADNNDFSLPSSARHSLSSILIVHPIAALLTLICFGLAVAAHFHSPAHSPRYLLALLILTFPTLLVALLAFLVDILLFVPHMQWGGWIVLAATILIIASGVVTCAMRRTLVSRKARKKRIAENAEMNGDNYYANLQEQRMMADELPRADSPPPMTGGIDGDKMAQFTYEAKSPERSSSDDRTPLNPRAPSVRSNSTGHGSRRPMISEEDAPPVPGHAQPMRDQYGNPLAPGAVAMANDLPPPGLRHHASRGSLGSQGSNRSNNAGGPPPPGYGRGRGGYGPRGAMGPGPGPGGRGGYGGPRGGYGPGLGPRGGYGPGRGNMGPQGSYRGGPQGMRGPPPPGWNGQPQNGRGMAPGMIAGAGAGMAAGAMMGRGGPQGPPPGYDNGYSSADDSLPPPGMAPYARTNGSPAPHSPQEQGEIGQAIEMDERHGSPPAAAGYGLRDNDGDVAGMVGLQQGRRDITPTNRNVSQPEPPTPSSIYSQQTYVPPRAAWAQPAPLVLPQYVQPISNPPPGPNHNARPLSPIGASPTSSRHNRVGSDNYYEDVDPRFAVDEPAPSPGLMPSSLIPGSQQASGPQRQASPGHLHPILNHDHSTPSLDRDSSYENIAEGARSPAGSDISHFTSVSQRGVNPNWRPPPGYGGGAPPGPMTGGGQGPGPRRGDQQRNDMILGANPDFSIPGMGPPRAGGLPGGRGGRGGGMPPSAMGRPAGGAGGLTPVGRYPSDM